jgi:predicted small lipoprotein YifL
VIKKILFVAVLSFLLTNLAGCGYKADPFYPETEAQK